MTTDLTNFNWGKTQKFSFLVLLFFIVLFICSVPFPHNYIPDIGNYTHVYFEQLIQWFGNNILHINHPYTVALISDSTGMYIHVLLLTILAIICSIVTSLFQSKINYKKLHDGLMACIRYYISMQLLKYGFDKLFKLQFYLPEPNTLYTTIGNTPRDLLYWSTMGISRTYSIFTGLTEIIAAVLLLFRRTQLLGAFMVFAIMVNVLMINISFDISVKIYAAFLLLLSVVLLLPYTKRLYHFFFFKHDILIQSKLPNPFYQSFLAYRMLKFIVIACIVFDGLSAYLFSKNFNDDTQPRPYLHGAYNVETFVANGDTIQPLTTNQFRWRRMFIHRRGYLITQLMNDEMKDYEMELDSSKHEIDLMNPTDSSFHIFYYKKMGDTALQLTGKLYEDALNIYLKKIDLQQLPLFKHPFNFTIDE